MADPTADGGPGWIPTHWSPTERLPAWSAPDGSAPPVAQVEPKIEARVVERTNDWAKVEFSNGWSGWVDGRKLESLTREIPPGGLSVWAEPDPQATPSGRANPGLTVQVLESSTGWAKVEFDNGWIGWLDGTALIAPGAAAPPPDPLASQGPMGGVGIRSTAPSTAAHPMVRASKPAGLTSPLPGAGAAVAIVGGLMPWFSSGGHSINAWKVPLGVLVDHTNTGENPKVGLTLFVVAVAALPYLTHKALHPAIYLLLGAIPVACAVGWYSYLDAIGVSGPAFGAYVSALGGLAIAGEVIQQRRT